MVKISFALAALMLVSITAFPDMVARSFVRDMLAVEDTQADVKNFVNGLIQGLKKSQTNPSQCADDIDAANIDLISLIDDIVALDAGDLSRVERLFVDATELFNNLEDSKDVCNYSAFVEILKALETDAGRKAIEENYIKNVFTVSIDLLALLKCEADYAKCGHNFGEIVRLLLGWGL